jgi:hypothetical protein
LASNNAVVLAFSETGAFGDATSHGGYIQYSASEADTKGGSGHVVHIVAYIDPVTLAGEQQCSGFRIDECCRRRWRIFRHQE